MQRVATNYFAAALMLPEQATVEFLQKAKHAKEIAVEDIRDAFAVSYETAAHRFTNLATQHLDIRTHFQKTHKSGIIYKAYENDGVTFPQDHTGAIEGQPSCKNWTSRVVFDVPDKFSAYNQYTDTPAGTYWCTARTDRSANGEFSLSVGRAVRTGEVVPRPGDHRAVQVQLPGRELLQAAAGLADVGVGGQCLAFRTGPLPPAGRHAAGRLPRRGRDRGVHLPAGALGELSVRSQWLTELPLVPALLGGPDRRSLTSPAGLSARWTLLVTFVENPVVEDAMQNLVAFRGAGPTARVPQKMHVFKQDGAEKGC